MTSAAAQGGSAVGNVSNGDWISFNPYNLSGLATGFTARVSAPAGGGGTLTMPVGLGHRAVVGTATVAATGSFDTFADVTGTITAPTGSGPLFLVFTGGGGAALFDIDSFGFTSGGTPPTGTNLALNKPATASSVEADVYPASAAVDASATTRWASAFADPQWIQVDLGATYAINRVRLQWEAAYGIGVPDPDLDQRHHLDRRADGDRRQRRRGRQHRL